MAETDTCIAWNCGAGHALCWSWVRDVLSSSWNLFAKRQECEPLPPSKRPPGFPQPYAIGTFCGVREQKYKDFKNQQISSNSYHFYYPETFHQNLSKSTLQANPLSLALCMENCQLWGAHFLDMKVVQSLLKLHLFSIACISQGETMEKPKDLKDLKDFSALWRNITFPSHSHRQRCLGNVNNFLL